MRKVKVIEEDVVEGVGNIDCVDLRGKIEIEGSVGRKWEWVRIGVGRFGCVRKRGRRGRG